MKKLISIFLLICMIFSLSVISYSQTTVDESLKLVSSYTTTNYIFLEFSEAVLFDETVKNYTTLTIKDDTNPLSYTASTTDEGKTLIIDVDEALSLDKAYTLNIPFIYNTSKTKFLFGVKLEISFTKYFYDDFQSYTNKTGLDTNLYRYYGASGEHKEFSTFESCDIVTDEAGNKSLKILGTGDDGVWINREGWSAWNQTNKYYTLEADFKIIKATSSGNWMKYCNSYYIGTGGVDYNMRFKTTGVEFANSHWDSTFKGQGSKPIDTYTGVEGVVVGENATTENIAVSTYQNKTNDSLDIFWDGEKIVHHEGTLRATGGGVWGALRSASKSTEFYVDNWKIYKPSVTASTESSYMSDIPTELCISGVLEEDEIASVDIADDTSPNVTTVYEWYKGMDKDSPLTDTEKWTKLDNTAKSYTVKAEDLTSYIVCRVKKTLQLNESEDFELFDITTAPLLAPFAPECKDFEFIYTKGDTSAELKATFEYYDANLDVQNGTVIKWEISTDKTTWTTLSETTDTLDVTDITDKYIKCTVTVKNDGLKGDEAIPVEEVYALPFHPTVTRVSISGTASVGSILNADYDYYDANGDKEKNSEFIWYRKSGATEQVIATDTLAYCIQSDDCGYSIGFKVIPKNEVHPQTTTEYRSNEIAIPEATYTPSYSGSSSGGGGSYTATVKPATKDDESADNEKVLEQLKENNKPAFEDIKNHWAEKEISELSEKEIVKGRENGFEPDEMITRAEWLTLLLRGIEEEASSKYEGIFDDVKEGEWYTQAVEKAYSLGLVSGDGENFNPNEKVTREQMAKMAVLVYEYKNGEIKDSKDIDFSDKDDMSAWAEEYIKKAVSAELMNGVTESEFSFSSSATRAQACVLLSRIIDSLK